MTGNGVAKLSKPLCNKPEARIKVQKGVSLEEAYAKNLLIGEPIFVKDRENKILVSDDHKARVDDQAVKKWQQSIHAGTVIKEGTKPKFEESSGIVNVMLPTNSLLELKTPIDKARVTKFTQELDLLLISQGKRARQAWIAARWGKNLDKLTAEEQYDLLIAINQHTNSGSQTLINLIKQIIPEEYAQALNLCLREDYRDELSPTKESTRVLELEHQNPLIRAAKDYQRNFFKIAKNHGKALCSDLILNNKKDQAIKFSCEAMVQEHSHAENTEGLFIAPEKSISIYSYDEEKYINTTVAPRIKQNISTLEDLIDDPKTSFEDVLPLLWFAMVGIDNSQILHPDIKPGNIMIYNSPDDSKQSKSSQRNEVLNLKIFDWKITPYKSNKTLSSINQENEGRILYSASYSPLDFFDFSKIEHLSAWQLMLFAFGASLLEAKTKKTLSGLKELGNNWDNNLSKTESTLRELMKDLDTRTKDLICSMLLFETKSPPYSSQHRQDNEDISLPDIIKELAKIYKAEIEASISKLGSNDKSKLKDYLNEKEIDIEVN